MLVYLATLNEMSRATQGSSLRRIVRLMGKDNGDPDRFWKLAWWRLTPADTVEIRRLLCEGFGSNTAKVTLCALKGVLYQCFRLGYMTGDEYHRAASWPRVLGADECPRGRMLTFPEVVRLRAACAAEPPFLAALDRALFETALGAGLRRDELVRLQLEDVAEDGTTLRVVGKRKKVRRIPLHPLVRSALAAWTAQRARFPFGATAMFVRVLEGRALDQPISGDFVWRRFRDLGSRAKVTFSPHDLRRTYISLSLSAGDMITTSKNAGHADPRTTAIYDKRPFNARVRTAMAVGELLAEGWKEKDL